MKWLRWLLPRHFWAVLRDDGDFYHGTYIQTPYLYLDRGAAHDGAWAAAIAEPRHSYRVVTVWAWWFGGAS